MNGGDEFEAPALARTALVTGAEAKELGICGTCMELAYEHVKNCFLIYSSLGKDSGFTIEDIRGKVEVLNVRANREDKNRVYLELSRRTEGGVYLSFAWEAAASVVKR